MAVAMDSDALAARIAEAMPRLKEELAALVAIPGLSEWAFPEHTREPLDRTFNELVPLLRDAGVERISSLELPETASILRTVGARPGPSSGKRRSARQAGSWRRAACPPADARRRRGGRSPDRLHARQVAGVAMIGVYALVAHRRAGLTFRQSLPATVFLLLVGLGLVGLKYFVH